MLNGTQTSKPRRRPQPGVVIGAIALVAALAGSASALPGKNTVDRNDVKKNAIGSKQIKAGAVTAEEIAAGGVDGGAIADGSVAAADLAAPEPFHVVGEPGEPQFLNGGEGDCVWKHHVPQPDGTAPLSFRRNALGEVQLRGVASASNGPGGDQVCDATQTGEGEDGVVFILPPAYQPQYLDFSSPGGAVAIAPPQGAAGATVAIPGGGAYTSAGLMLLDGAGYPAASPAATRGAEAPAKLSPRLLRSLGVR